MNIFDFRERGLCGVDEDTETLAQRTIGAMIEVHRELGPGLPEAAYRNALARELELQGIPCLREVPVPIRYKGRLVADGRIDLLVGGVLVIELKAVEALTDVHRAQLLSYLRASKLQLGLLVNFNLTTLRDGIRRVINTS